MIKLIGLEPGDAELDLRFSDGSHGAWSAEALVARDTELTHPIADPAYFRRAFIEAGALAWPNGMELSAPSLHRRLAEAGALVCEAAQGRRCRSVGGPRRVIRAGSGEGELGLERGGARGPIL